MQDGPRSTEMRKSSNNIQHIQIYTTGKNTHGTTQHKLFPETKLGSLLASSVQLPGFCYRTENVVAGTTRRGGARLVLNVLVKGDGRV